MSHINLKEKVHPPDSLNISLSLVKTFFTKYLVSQLGHNHSSVSWAKPTVPTITQTLRDK